MAARPLEHDHFQNILLVLEQQRTSFRQCSPSIEHLKRYTPRTIQDVTLYLDQPLILSRREVSSELKIRGKEFIRAQKGDNGIIFFQGPILNEKAETNLAAEVAINIKTGKGEVRITVQSTPQQKHSLTLVKR